VQITYHQPHVLLLDEPSNHLDMDAVDALIEGLNEYKGGILMVSHDQWLIEATMDQLWLCEGGTITVFDGSFEDYKVRLRSR
jgi:ATP-binding cassette subfamily F protein 3